MPRHFYRAELRLGPGQWHVSPNLEWAPRGAWADYSNSFRVKGYATIGLSGAATVTGNTELFVDVRNLTGKKAVGDISAVVNYQALSPAQRSIFYPIERRAVYAGVRTKW